MPRDSNRSEQGSANRTSLTESKLPTLMAPRIDLNNEAGGRDGLSPESFFFQGRVWSGVSVEREGVGSAPTNDVWRAAQVFAGVSKPLPQAPPSCVSRTSC